MYTHAYTIIHAYILISIFFFFFLAIDDLKNLETHGGNIWYNNLSVFFFSSIKAAVLASTISSKLLAYFSSIFTM